MYSSLPARRGSISWHYGHSLAVCAGHRLDYEGACSPRVQLAEGLVATYYRLSWLEVEQESRVHYVSFLFPSGFPDPTLHLQNTIASNCAKVFGALENGFKVGFLLLGGGTRRKLGKGPVR